MRKQKENIITIKKHDDKHEPFPNLHFLMVFSSLLYECDKGNEKKIIISKKFS